MMRNPELQAQGLQSLSQMAASHSAARVAVTQLAWERLVQCAGHVDEDVHRCAITAMADLLSSEPTASVVRFKPDLHTAVAHIRRGLQSKVQEVARQSARALHSLGMG